MSAENGRRASLDRQAEADVLRLLDRYELVPGFDLAVVVGDDPNALAELRSRLSSVGPLELLRPSGSILREIEAYKSGKGRPIVWVEAARWDTERWDAALSIMNQGRERLTEGLSGLLILAGTPELLPMTLEHPDLGSKLGPVVRLSGVRSSVSPAKLRWLHLSDLHFTSDERWERRAVLQSLLRFLKDEVVSKGLGPQLVLVTGDVASRGKQVEYEQAEGFFRELMDTLRLRARDHLFIVPGNHDVDRSRIGPLDRLASSALLEAKDQAKVEEILTNPAALSALGARLENFYAFTRRLLGAGRAWQAERPWRADHIEIDGLPVGLVQLNTAWASGPTDAKDKLLVGEAQVREALHELPDVDLRVGMMHHPPPWLAEFDERRVRGLLESKRGVDFILHGHTHDEDAALRRGPDGQTHVFGAGATYVAGPWHKGCVLVELDQEAGEGRAHYFGYSERGAGFWHADPTRHEGAPDGLWTFELPPHLRHAGAMKPPCGPAQADAKANANADATHDAQVVRYRSAAASVHDAVSFIGIPDRSRRPPSATVAQLFAPLHALRRGAVEAGGSRLSVPDLAQALVSRDDHDRARRLVLLGDPGSGKTTLTKYLAVWAAGGLAIDGVERHEGIVPLHIPFREHIAEVDRGQSADLIEFLVRQASDQLQSPRDRVFFERLLREGRALVLLDGLDEVSRPRDREAARNRILAFCDAWPHAPVLVTSRRVGYDDAALPEATHEKLSESSPNVGEPGPGETVAGRFEHLVLQPLDDESQEELVRRWYRVQEAADPRARQHATEGLLAALRAEPRAQKLARNPLLATLVCLVHRQRATLPGERVKLYELVVETLLETWTRVKHGSHGFLEIDPGRQRRYLESLALELQRRRVANAAGKVVIARRDLIRTLVGIAGAGSPDDEATLEDRVARWVDWLASRTGLLVEQRPAVFGFLHLTLMEYLAACALSREIGAGGAEPLVLELHELARTAAWNETIRMVLGLRADEPAFVRAVVDSFSSGGREQVLLLLHGLREEMDVDAPTRRRILRAVWSGGTEGSGEIEEEALRTLLDLTQFSTRHAEGTREMMAEFLLGCEDVRRLPPVLLGVLPRLVPDAEVALAAVDHLRRRTSDGGQLYFLWAALEEVAERWPDSAARANEQREQLFDHLPVPPRELFETVQTAQDGEVPLWCDIPAGRFEIERVEGTAVMLRPFRIACVPVTLGQYLAFDANFDIELALEGSSSSEVQLNLPVTNVTCHDAVSWCRWLSSRAAWARGARLPTMDEWEYACRAGMTTQYWSGDSEEDLARVGWYADNSGSRLHLVGELPANPWGLYDVHGNVQEWCDIFRNEDEFGVCSIGSWDAGALVIQWRTHLMWLWARSSDLGFRPVLPRVGSSGPIA